MGQRRTTSMEKAGGKGKWPSTEVMSGNNNSKDFKKKKKSPMQMKGGSSAKQASKSNAGKLAKGFNVSAG